MKNKYEQVADFIEGRIAAGAYAYADFIPGERALGEELKVSRVTVRKGLDMLRHRRVLEPVAGKGYQIVKSGHASKRKATQLIGGVFPCLHPLSTTISSESISDVLEEKGFHLIYSSSGDSLSTETGKIEDLMERGVDGLILMPSYRRGANELATTDELGNHEYVKKLYDSGFPIVLIDRSYAEGGIPCVCSDDVRGGYMAAEYFIGRGFKEIIYFLPVLERIGRRRFQGYCGAMRQHGLEARRHVFKDPQHVMFDDEERMREVERLVRGLDKDTALVTGGFFPASLSAVIRTPGHKGPDVQWIGCDFSARDMRSSCPPFPYLKRPMAAMGARVAEKMLRLVGGDKSAAEEEFLHPEIMQA